MRLHNVDKGLVFGTEGIVVASIVEGTKVAANGHIKSVSNEYELI